MGNKQKVLHIVDSLALGGTQTLLKGIFEFQKDNQNIFLYSLRNKKIKVEINHENMFGFESKSKYSLSPIKELRKIIKEKDIKILHCHLLRSFIFGYILKKLYYPNIILVFHEHGKIFTDNFFYNFFLKFVKTKVNLFLAISKETEKQLIKKAKIKKEKIKVLYNFVDLERFNKNKITWDVEKEKKKLGIKKDEFVFGFAGRLVKRKGWREFVEAAKLTEKSHSNFKFLIAGDGEDKEDLLKFLKDNNLEKRVVFLGYVSDMVWFYSILDCFIIPSHWEPMGLTEIEAQALGIPVISSNVPALNEIIIDGENGLLFEGKDSEDLGEKIKFLFSKNNLRKEIIKKSFSSVKDFSLKNYLKELNFVYEK